MNRVIDQLVYPITNKFEVEMNLPGSKSITLRNLILASLADGRSEIKMPGICDDTYRMKDSLQRLGIRIEEVDTQIWNVYGNNGEFIDDDVELDIGMSGTSTRFLIAYSILRQATTTLDGHESLRARPNKYLTDALQSIGVSISASRDGYLPVSIKGSSVYPKNITLRGDKSSQYFSAMMQIASALPQGLIIEVEGELVSKPYIDITINEMNKFGLVVENNNYEKFSVSNQTYQGIQLTVEGDASAASYFSSLATLHGGKVIIKNLGTSTKQGDFNFFKVCELLGARVTYAENETIIQGSIDGRLNPLNEIDMEMMPDVALTLIVIAPLIPGRTRITGLSTLRIKECDRISCPVRELRKIGVSIEEGDDYVVVDEYPLPVTTKVTDIETYDDHRMAMSFAILATKLGNLNILDAECVNKTYPYFWEDLKRFYYKEV
ncbi:3-phosphoshikimate 1-carboxyvinyltransferase [Paenibacillus sp. NPDC058177]|uniref:3-phosphoshikimate 1-carboxyvinyltransferase n=1 Tax=Paenibacillus sp. NPDC058177 TaxID=3346369 RepID=UPI0036D91F48